MADNREPLDEHWPDGAMLELADKTWDQIDHLLGAIASGWPDPHEELAMDARIRRHFQQGGG